MSVVLSKTLFWTAGQAACLVVLPLPEELPPRPNVRICPVIPQG